MKNPLNYFKTVEAVRLGNDEVPIEHSALENILGFVGIGIVATITSPIWIPGTLYLLGKEGYPSKKE